MSMFQSVVNWCSLVELELAMQLMDWNPPIISLIEVVPVGSMEHWGDDQSFLWHLIMNLTSWTQKENGDIHSCSFPSYHNRSMCDLQSRGFLASSDRVGRLFWLVDRSCWLGWLIDWLSCSIDSVDSGCKIILINYDRSRLRTYSIDEDLEWLIDHSCDGLSIDLLFLSHGCNHYEIGLRGGGSKLNHVPRYIGTGERLPPKCFFALSSPQLAASRSLGFLGRFARGFVIV